jgi:hypothetical protein
MNERKFKIQLLNDLKSRKKSIYELLPPKILIKIDSDKTEFTNCRTGKPMSVHEVKKSIIQFP